MIEVQQELAQLRVASIRLVGRWNKLAASTGWDWETFTQSLDEGASGRHPFDRILLNVWCEGWSAIEGVNFNEEGDLQPACGRGAKGGSCLYLKRTGLVRTNAHFEIRSGRGRWVRVGQDRLAASDVLHQGRDMASMSARIPDPLAARFDAFASSRGGKSRVLRALMEAALNGSTPPVEVSGSALGRSSKITLRLREEDLAALDDACADAGLRRTEWIVALVRRRLSGRPQFDRASATLLLEARRELRRLGVNLREMAGDDGGASASQLEALRAEVREQLEGVRQAVAGNLAYWDEAGR